MRNEEQLSSIVYLPRSRPLSSRPHQFPNSRTSIMAFSSPLCSDLIANICNDKQKVLVTGSRSPWLNRFMCSSLREMMQIDVTHSGGGGGGKGERRKEKFNIRRDKGPGRQVNPRVTRLRIASLCLYNPEKPTDPMNHNNRGLGALCSQFSLRIAVLLSPRCCALCSSPARPHLLWLGLSLCTSCISCVSAPAGLGFPQHLHYHGLLPALPWGFAEPHP